MPGKNDVAPRPTLELSATYQVPHGSKALAVSKGVDRDRTVDERGNPSAVFSRGGTRPPNREE